MDTISCAIFIDCPANQFQCLDDTCISEMVRCDGFFNCAQGEDELHCTVGKWLAWEFACDCEQSLSHVNPLAYGADMFECVHDGNCILSTSVCDGIIDCNDETDEIQCGKFYT